MRRSPEQIEAALVQAGIEGAQVRAVLLAIAHVKTGGDEDYRVTTTSEPVAGAWAVSQSVWGSVPTGFNKQAEQALGILTKFDADLDFGRITIVPDANSDPVFVNGKQHPFSALLQRQIEFLSLMVTAWHRPACIAAAIGRNEGKEVSASEVYLDAEPPPQDFLHNYNEVDRLVREHPDLFLVQDSKIQAALAKIPSWTMWALGIIGALVVLSVLWQLLKKGGK